MSSKEELRREHNKRVLSGEYKEKLGCTCVNCGSQENIEYHHIVPLCMGGTNRMTNIVPVCKNCHVAIHGEAEYRKLAFKNACKKVKPTFEEFDKVLRDYADCKIDLETTKNLLGVGPKRGLSNKKEYKMFLYRNKIKKIVNHVGQFISSENWPPKSKNALVGYILYENGETKQIFAKEVFDTYESSIWDG